MKAFTIQLPKHVDETEFRWHLASYLFEKALMTSGEAAELIGVSKKEFLLGVGKYGVSVFGESANDIAKLINE